ncbi:MAG: hypothetical protein LBS74_05350 [Oscillospiraceae bacterium]|nr:hypothetical protein [Oscillospiraceae bacterium]
MVKGVNRCIIEVKETGNPFFERVICFVRPEYCSEGFPKLHKTAERYVKGLAEEEHGRHKSLLRTLKALAIPAASALAGLAIGFLVNIIV